MRPVLLFSILLGSALTLVTTLPGDCRAQTPPLRLETPRSAEGVDLSGQGQTVHLDETATLAVRVVDADDQPTPGVVVRFDRTDRGPTLLGRATTTPMGIARIEYAVGGEKATHNVVARIEGNDADGASLLLRVHARAASWTIWMLMGLAGGLALFLLGMEMLSGALRRRAGSRLRSVLTRFTEHRVIGVFAGALVTMLIQSSSATTVLLVSFVQAGLLSFTRTLSVILGSDIGTTVTVQLIAFKVTDFALPVIAVGFALHYLTRRPRLRDAGEALLGFGILFFGLAIMAEVMEPLRDYAPLVSHLHTLRNPILGVLVGTLFTGLIQSSAAFLGIVLVLAQQGLLGLEQGIPLMFGANIGTCITAVLASARSSRAARRVAIAHVTFKVGGVLLFLFWVPQFAALVSRFDGGSFSIARQIANAHTVFNVSLAIVFLPFTGVAARWLERAFPDVDEEEEPSIRARYLDPQMLATPALAISLAKVEILDLARRVQRMADQVLGPILDNNPALLPHLHDEEERVDALVAQIHDYLIKVGQQQISQERMREVYLMLHVSVQLEGMADVIDKELRPLAAEKIRDGVHFSANGRNEIEAFHLKMLKQISRAIEVFTDSSLEGAKRMKKKQAKYDQLDVNFRQAHFERLKNAVSESVESSGAHLDVMDSLNKITLYATSIAKALIAQDSNGGAKVTSADSSR